MADYFWENFLPLKHGLDSKNFSVTLSQKLSVGLRVVTEDEQLVIKHWGQQELET